MNEHWIVDLALDRELTWATSEPLGREIFLDMLWAECGDALVGIDQGSVDVDEAAARGLIATSRVIDAAAAPADRDWLGDSASQAVSCWFTGESAARDAAAWLAGITGCRVHGIRRHASADQPDWREAFVPIVVPGFGTIAPSWDDGHAHVTPAGVRMFIEPGVGFGTGLHETTQLCLRSLAEWRATGGPMNRVLDFGSGSGILGIAAVLLGAMHVDAVESDTTVHGAIRANAVRNGVGDRVHVRSSLPDAAEPYDAIVANIVAPVLIAHAPDVCGRLRPASRAALILCGLGADDLPEVGDRYAAALGSSPAVTTADGWHCLRFHTG